MGGLGYCKAGLCLINCMYFKNKSKKNCIYNAIIFSQSDQGVSTGGKICEQLTENNKCVPITCSSALFGNPSR